MIKRFILYFISFSVLLGFIFWLFYQSDIQSHKRLIASELKDHVNMQSNAIAFQFRNVVSDCAIFAESHELRQLADNSEDYSPKELEDDFLSISLRKGLYDQIRFIEAHGQEILRVDYNNGKPLLVPENQLQNKADRYYFKETMALAREEVFISPLDLNLEKGEVERPFKPMIRFGTPILNRKGEKRGALILNFLAQSIIDDFKNGTHHQFGQQDSLLNSEGYWLAGSKAENEWGFMLRERKDKTFEARRPGSWKRVLSEDTGQFPTDEGLFTFTTVYPFLATRDLKGFSEKAHSVSLPNAKTYFWKIVSFLPQEVLNNASYEKLGELRNRLTKLYAALLLLIGSGTFFFASTQEKRKRSEEKLKESEERFRKLSETTFEGIVIVQEGRIVEANAAFAELFGYGLYELVGKPILELAAQESRKMAGKNIDAGHEKPYELVGLRKDGSTLLCEVHGITSQYKGCKARITAIRDITERKKAEKALRENEEKYRTLVESSPYCIHQIGLDGKFLSMNRAGLEMINETNESCIIGVPYLSAASEEDRERVSRLMKAAFAGEFSEFEFVSEGGLFFCSNFVPLLDSNGKVDRLLGITQNITERKKAEEEIKRYRDNLEDEVAKRTSELRFQKFALDEHAIVSATDADGNITYANDKFCEISGYTREELVGKNHRILKSGEHPPEFYRDMWHTISNGKVWHGEVKNRNKNDDYYWVKATMVPSIGESKKPYQYISIRTDITDRKNAEKELNKYASEMEQLAEERSRQLIHADRMITLGTLSAGVAHEINNPVGFISNNLQIFEKLWNQTIRAYLEKANRENEDQNLSFALDEMPMMVKAMKEGATRIINIVRDLGKFSRKTIPVFEPSNICEVIKAAVKLSRLDLTVKYKVKIQLDLPNDIPNIKISRQEMEQVLINLITNSGHAMEEITDRKELILKIAASHVSNNIVIEITDNGHGMDEKTLNNIFNPFFTTKDVGKGTGLGLSICLGIIEQHRGDITATSNSGEGTTFTITLPIDPQKKDEKSIGESV